MTRLFVIRHALAADADDLRLPGLDGALLPAGKAQARAVAQRVRALAPSGVYSSDARRARETGEIIAAACQIPLEVNAALGEIDFGTWAGQTYADSSPRIPPHGHGSRTRVPARRRVANLSPSRQSGCCASCVRSLMAMANAWRSWACGLAPPRPRAGARDALSSYWRLRLDCASLSILTWAADGLVLERLNDTAHLEVQTPDLPRVQVTERG